METEHLKSVNGPPGSLYSQRVPAENRGSLLDSKSALSDIPIQSVGYVVDDVAQMRHGHFADFPASKLSDFFRPDVLDNVPAHALFSTMNRILDESIEKTNENVPHRVARFLKKILQAIEGRTSTQLEYLKNKISVYKIREEKYILRLKALEVLSAGTNDENEVVMNQLKKTKIDKLKVENEKKLEGMEMINLLQEKAKRDAKILLLNHDIEEMKEEHEKSHFILNSKAKKAETELEMQLKERDALLSQLRMENKNNKEFFETAKQKWNEKEHQYLSFTNYFLRSLQELKIGSEAVKRDVLKSQRSHSNDASRLGSKVKGLVDLVENYHTVLSENRRLYNEVQDLKGNIRIYCRIRPFLPGQNKKQTTIEYVGDNGELFIAKQGKENRRPFKFNKVFGQTATQEEVFMDTQPLIRSVLDGFNVCIFAYGQTGSGKTYTMSGADISSKEHWGVNYRALNDLFLISQSRMDCIKYEVGVQMVEIYNEQVRDLLSSNNNQKRLEILSTAKPNGLVVPNASMHPVKSTRDVMDLMNNGLMNRAVGATALNDRSSRSHSVLTVHVRGVDMETDATLRGNLHLVDLAGSERVLRSEATGERLKEAQHINKSLSALGDVIFALAQKSPHVPYRNSKLTQLLQSSLGGQAKTLMFVQLNPDVDSYSETISTLKFAERVSGVELGAARSSKEGKDVRSLMDQISSLKNQISVKDGEIEQLKTIQRSPSSDLLGIGATKFVSSPRRHSLGAPRQIPKPSGEKWSRLGHKVAADLDNCSDCSGDHSEAGSQQSDELRRQNEVAVAAMTKLDERNADQNTTEDVDILGFGEDDSEERLSDISDGGLSMGTETDVSTNSVVEFTLFPESSKQMENTDKSSVPTKLPRPPQKMSHSKTTPLLSARSSSKVSRSAHSIAKKGGGGGAIGGSSSAVRPGKRWQ